MFSHAAGVGGLVLGAAAGLEAGADLIPLAGGKPLVRHGQALLHGHPDDLDELVEADPELVIAAVAAVVTGVAGH